MTVPDLPGGYKERMDDATLKLMEQARKIMEICKEFACDNVELTDGEITVVIGGAKCQ